VRRAGKCKLKIWAGAKKLAQLRCNNSDFVGEMASLHAEVADEIAR